MQAMFMVVCSLAGLLLLFLLNPLPWPIALLLIGSMLSSAEFVRRSIGKCGKFLGKDIGNCNQKRDHAGGCEHKYDWLLDGSGDGW